MKINNLRITKHDDIESAKEKNNKLIIIIKKLEQQVRQLRSNNTTLQDVFGQTEVFLREITEGMSLKEILKNVNENKPLTKLRRSCPNCQSRNMKKIQFKEFHIIICGHCSHREKIDESIK